MTVSLEQAVRCPKCNTPGKLISNRKHRDERLKVWDLTEYMCDVRTCLWNGVNWFVQSDEKGVVFERKPMEKTFKPLTPDQISFGRRVVEDAIGREYDRDDQPG